jgi:hypothetical protein
VIRSERLHDAFLRQIAFSGVILAIEIPLGVAVALCMPKKGWLASLCLVLMALPLLIPWNVVGTIWQVFGRVDIGLLGYTLAGLGIDYNYTQDPFDAWVTVVVMDVWHWTSLVALLAYAGLQSIPSAYYQAAQDRPGQPLGGVPLYRAAEDEGRAADRGAAALHGQLHDLHRTLCRHRRRPGLGHHLPVHRPREDGHRAVRPRPGGGVLDHVLPRDPAAELGVLHGDDQRR